jgi:hypothetical protein
MEKVTATIFTNDPSMPACSMKMVAVTFSVGAH